MWDRLNFFGWSKKKMSVQPVQRDISITLTNGDRKETIHRSPSGTKMASSSTANAKRGVEDDESSEGSTSLNFGIKAGPSGRRNSSYSFSREPLDLPTWSNVTSPGFTSRLVQQASGHSPLKEFNDSLSHSPFRKSPYKDLSLGELPYVSFSRKSKLPPPAFPSPNTSFKGGASSSMYNRDRRKHARQGQVFVRIAPIDPSIRANVLVPRQSSSPTTSSPFPPRGSPRTGGEPYRNEGLGGIPQQELTMRFNRLWPHSPGSPVPGPGRPSSPTSPSNIMEALVVGRKRAREQDTFYPPNATPPSMSPPTKISVGIGDTPVRPQMSKRVKFVGGPEGHDRPMMVSYSGIGGGDTEPLSSESILEQMNQTEKRFLPDSTSTPYSFQKKPIRTSEEQSSNLMRKRRSQTNLMSVIEDEPRSEKVGRFCACNDCYAESTGSMLHSPSGSPIKCHSSGKSDEKGTNTGDSRSKETCDKGVSTDSDQGEYFRGIFRNADRFKNLSTSEEPEGSKDDIMKFGKLVYTKEMHDRDKRKRIERYYRLLKLKPPEDSSILDTSQNQADVSVTTTSALSQGTLNGTGLGGSAFNFGSPAATSLAPGPLFGTTSPIAHTVTTSACTTITSPSSSAGNLMGSSISSTVPTASTTMSFGMGNAGIPTPAPGSSLASPTPLLGSNGTGLTVTSSLNQSMFSSGLSTLAKPTQVEPSSTTTSATYSATTTTTAGPGGFNFSSPSTSAVVVPTFGSVSATAPSSIFGGGTATSNAGFGTLNAPPQTQTSAGGFGFTSPQSQPTDSLSTSTSSGGFSFGQSITNPKSGAESTSFQFGQRATQDVPDVAKTQANNTSVNAASLNPAQALGTTGSGFSFGGTVASTTASTTPLFGAHTSTIAPTVTTSASTTKALAAGGLGSSATPTNASFGIGIPTPASTLTFSNPTSSDNSGTGLNTGNSLGQNIFSSGSSALAKPTQAEPSSTTTNATHPTTTATAGGFSFSDPSTSTFGSVGATSPSSIFGGGSATSGGFGPSFTTPSQSQNSAAGFGFGGSSNSQPPAQSTTSAGGFSFGQSNTTVASAAGGFQFNAGSTSGTAPPPYPFGQGAPAPATSNSSTPANRITSSNTSSSLGQVMFPSVTNPLAKPKPAGLTPATNTTTATTNAGGFNFSTPSTTATLTTPNFPSMTSTSASSTSIFGGGTVTGTGTTNAGFGFGQSFTMSAPQSQTSTSGGFGFGANANPQPSAPTAASPGGFAFGQGQPNPPPPAASPGGAIFQFGQQPSAGSASGAGFQFGQQAAQGVPGGFNFAASPQAAGGGPPMFNMGSASTAPRRRDIRRRHR